MVCLCSAENVNKNAQMYSHALYVYSNSELVSLSCSGGGSAWYLLSPRSHPSEEDKYMKHFYSGPSILSVRPSSQAGKREQNSDA